MLVSAVPRDHLTAIIDPHDDIAWGPNGRASDVPITERGAPNPLASRSVDGFVPLTPSKSDIAKHLYALFSPEFVQAYPDGWIEIAYGHATTGGNVTAAENFSVFELQDAIKFAEAKNKAGYNIYVGPAIRQGNRPASGRASDNLVVASAFSWAEFDREGDAERIHAILKENYLSPALIVTTGSVPYLRAHLYFRLTDGVSPDRLKAANTSLVGYLGGDSVQNTSRVMRLAGTVNYPTPDKKARGYIAEVVALRQPPDARVFSAEELIGLTVKSNQFRDSCRTNVSRDDGELTTLLEASRLTGNWHNSIRNAIATMIGRNWSDAAIRFACAPYCRGGTEDPDLTPLIDGARQKWNKPNVDQDGLPTIEIEDGELSSLATRGEEVLITAGVAIYQRGGRLVRPIVETVDATRGRQTKIVQLKALDDVYLRDLLCRNARWEKYNARSKARVLVNPPSEVAQTILARTGDWKFPAIAGVISAPTMRPDGSLLTEPGYDRETRLLLVEPPPMPPIPERPTREDAEQALVLLEALLTGFPFDDEVAEASALSAIITPVVRGAFPVTPMHASRAPTAGSGKSFLWDIVASITIGQPMPVLSTGASVEEMEKRLGSALMAGQPLISIDNITGELGGDALCQIIERPFVDVRILGRSESVRVEARGTSLFATGNNFVIVGDVCRRTVTSNLDPQVERPELRQFDFDPVDRVLADRGKYIAAALTICRAYFVAGKPDKAPRLASFEGWSDTVRSALIWLGKEDPVKSMETARAEDPERAELSDMLEAWSRVIGTGSESRRKLADVLTKGLSMSREDLHSELEPSFPDFYAALMAMALRSSGKSMQPDARMFGKWLQRFKGRIVDDRRFMCRSDAKRGNEWWVEQVG
ncbi:hypothetical protein H8A95_19940 [Bradyrhizobium sp. Pear76]|uniref:hypothetical protein n=1 Tax=Bradyrhizobium oropedii TaxID=1571201 RepID=UPI001E3F71C6|nr:hypothetical protein [Bradyrhizobium oropedii]MCC8964525.1 hypothetical protein [Bradyrhizobium oropedii]